MKIKKIDILGEVIKGSQYKLTIFSKAEIDELKNGIDMKTIGEKRVPFLKCVKMDKEVRLNPKEIIRWLMAARLIEKYGYATDRIEFDFPLKLGKRNRKADIVVLSADGVDGGKTSPVYIAVDLKSSSLVKGKELLQSVFDSGQAEFGIWTNGAKILSCCKGKDGIIEMSDIPRGSSSLNSFRIKRRGKALSLLSDGKGLNGLGSISELQQKLSDILDPYASLKRLTPMDEFVKRQGFLYKDLLDRSGIPGMETQEQVKKLARIFEPSEAMKGISESRYSFEYLAKIPASFTAQAEKLAEISNSFKMKNAKLKYALGDGISAQAALAESLKPISDTFERLKEVLGPVSDYTALAQNNLLLADNEDFRKRIGLISEEKIIEFKGILGRLAGESYSFYKTYENQTEDVAPLPPELLIFPAESMFCHSEIVKSFSYDEPNEENEEECRKRSKEIDRRNKEYLNDNLEKLDAELPKMYNGAHQALETDNPDRISHYAISMWKLINSILCKFVPDEDIKNFTDNPESDMKGSPNIEARLMFITHKTNLERVGEFLRLDIESTLEMINILNSVARTSANSTLTGSIEKFTTQVELLITKILRVGKMYECLPSRYEAMIKMVPTPHKNRDQNAEHEVFISYSSKDESIAEKYCEGLKKENIKCWMFRNDQKVGAFVIDEIAEVIKRVKYFLLLLSKSSINSDYVRCETRFAFEKKVDFIPIYLEDIKNDLPGSIEFPIIGRHAIFQYDMDTFKDQDPFERCLRDVIQRIQQGT